jgi:tetratricopeptide (TPR) repeat protein
MVAPTLLVLTALQGAATTTDRGPAAEVRGERPGVEPFLAKGLSLYRQRQFQAARRAFEEAVEANPSSAAAHFYLGYTLYKIGEPTKRRTPEKVQAVEEFARCFELDRSFRPTWSW